MINHFLLISSVIIIYEFLRYVQFIKTVETNFKIYKKILKLFNFKNISDFRKEKLILNYSRSLFIVSIKIFINVISIFIFILTINYFSKSFLNLMISIFGIIKFSIIFIIYHFVRRKFHERI